MLNVLANPEARVFFKDLESRFLLVSAGYVAAVAQGCSPDEVVGKTDFDIFSWPHAVAAFEDERRVIETGDPLVDKVERETYRDRPDAWVATNKFPLRDEHGSIVGTWGISRDITGPKQMEERLGAMFESAPDGIVIVDHSGQVVQVNPRAEELFGYRREELVGQPIEILVPEGLRDRHAGHRATFSADPQIRPMALGRGVLGRPRDGRAFPVEISLSSFQTEGGRFVSSVIRDVSDRQRAEEKLRDSERRLRSVIDNTPALVSVKGRDFRYQLVNREFEDVFGVRSDWIVGRGDEEILPACAVDEVRAKDRLVLDGGQAVQEEETVLHDGRQRVLLTIRFPLLDERGEVEAVCVTSTDITERRLEERSCRERVECSEQIHSALAEDRFVLHAQPIVNLASMQLEHAELLIRMRTGHGGEDLGKPAGFLPGAERFDLIHLIDEWVIDRALELATAGHRVALNLSAKTICDPRQVNRIESAVLASAVLPENLVFEITETAAADNFEAARDFATRLRKLGCAIALDDFGVGHGTFSYLRHLPIDHLKIDMRFVRDLLSDEEDRQVVSAIVAVAKQFEITTIAEGVEDQATLEELRRMGIDYAQGYHLGLPVPLLQLWQSPEDQGGDANATEAGARQGTEPD
jgi:PAS domain S-box-containing protein